MANVHALVYAEYARTSNLFAVFIYAVMLIGGQTLQIGKAPLARMCQPLLVFHMHVHPRWEDLMAISQHRSQPQLLAQNTFLKLRLTE
jgi:hypothetical protein